jgi:hypothetical protein
LLGERFAFRGLLRCDCLSRDRDGQESRKTEKVVAEIARV